MVLMNMSMSVILKYNMYFKFMVDLYIIKSVVSTGHLKQLNLSKKSASEDLRCEGRAFCSVWWIIAKLWQPKRA